MSDLAAADTASLEGLALIADLSPEELGIREALFATALAQSFNVSEAARAAMWTGPNVAMTGAHMLRRPRVKKLVKAAIQARMARLQATGDRIMQEQLILGFSDIGDVVEFLDNGLVRLRKRIPKRARRAIAAIKIKRSVERTGPGKDDWEEFETVEIKMHNKAAALGLLMKSAGLLTDRLEIEMKTPAKLTVRRMTKAEQQAAQNEKTTP